MREMVIAKNSIMRSGIEEETEIAGSAEKIQQKAPDTDRPCLPYLCAHVLEALQNQPCIRKPFAIVGLRSHAGNPAFPANRFKEMAPLQGGRGFCGKPRADNNASFRSQDAMGLRKEHLLVLHVFRAFDREDGIEHSRWKIVLQPVAQEILGIVRASAIGTVRGGIALAKS